MNSSILPQEIKTAKVSIEGHYEEGSKTTPPAKNKVWVPSQLIVECGCGEILRAGVELLAFPCEECMTDHTTLVHQVRQALAENDIHLQHRGRKAKKTTRRPLYKASEIRNALTWETSQLQGTDGANRARSVPNQTTDGSVTPDDGVESFVRREDFIVIGELDLKHHTIERAVDFKGGWFLGKVDFRSCEFKQAVNFSDCTFYKEFNSGDQFGSHTLYRRELNCSASRFVQAAKFNGIRVEGSVYFNGSSFELEGTDKSSDPNGQVDYAADFTDASLGPHVECMNAVFEGPVSFNSLKCGGAGFFDGVRFGEEVSFAGASFGSTFECMNAVFEGPVSFNVLRCTAGFFDSARFVKKVNFVGASFDSRIECKNAVFEEPVSFNSLKCNGAGLFDSTKFAKEVTLRLSTFKSLLRCHDTVFGGALDSSFLECTYDCDFGCAVFKGSVNFRGLWCGATGHFRSAKFIGDNTFDGRYARFGRDLDLRGAYFAGAVKLGQVRIMNRLRLGASRFDAETEFYNSDIKILELMDANYPEDKYPIKVRVSKQPYITAIVATDVGMLHNTFSGDTDQRRIDKIFRRDSDQMIGMVKYLFPFQQPRSLNLTGLNFERFHGGPNRELARRLALKLVQEQDPKKFSRDPYLQLEKYYDTIGEEDDALDMHYSGHRALRTNAIDFSRDPEKGRVKWPWIKIWVTDFSLKYLTGYGHKAWRAAMLLIPFIILGTLVLWGDDTLVKKSDLTTVGHVSFWESLAYNVDLVIPVLSFPFTDAWAPHYLPGKVCAVVEVVIGWLLVPLAIAAWTGVIKTRNV